MVEREGECPSRGTGCGGQRRPVEACSKYVREKLPFVGARKDSHGMVAINYYVSGVCLLSLNMYKTDFQDSFNVRPDLKAPLPRSDTSPVLLHILTTGLHLEGGSLPSTTHSTLPLLPIGSGNFETNLDLYKYTSNLVPVILTTPMKMELTVFRNVGT
jgi:hypothetical protein